jgi:hypothetical protein
MSLAFHTSILIMYEKYNDHRSGASSTACLKSIRIEWDVDQELLVLCMWCCTCKKYKDRTGRRSGAPYFLYALVR